MPLKIVWASKFGDRMLFDHFSKSYRGNGVQRNCVDSEKVNVDFQRMKWYRTERNGTELEPTQNLPTTIVTVAGQLSWRIWI